MLLLLPLLWFLLLLLIVVLLLQLLLPLHVMLVVFVFPFFSYITLTLHARCTDHIPNVENSRTMMFLLYAPSFVLRHHHFVLLDGIDRAVVCILGGARKAIS